MKEQKKYREAYVIHTGKKEHFLRLINENGKNNINNESDLGEKSEDNRKKDLETRIVENTLKHEIFSNPVPEEYVKEIVLELKERFENQGIEEDIELNVYWHDSKTRIISASGSPDIDVLLKDTKTWKEIIKKNGKDNKGIQLFVCKKIGVRGKKTKSGDRFGLNSPTRLLRQRYPFGTIVNITKDGSIWWPEPKEYPRKIEIDYLLKEPWAAWDLEFWHQLEKEYDKNHIVFSAPYFTNSSFGNYLFTYLDCGIKEIKFGDFLISKYEPKLKEFIDYLKNTDILNKNFLDFKIKKVKPPITKEFGKIEYQHNPVFLFGHNINKDKRILRKIGEYFPSVGGKKSVNKSHAFQIKELTFGRETIDTYQQIYQRGLGMTESLESELIRMGVPFLKGLDLYGILHHLYTSLNTKKAKKIRERSARIITEYAIMDSYVSAILGRSSLKELLLQSYMFQTSPSNVCLKKYDKLGEEKELRTRLIVNKFHDNSIPKNRKRLYKRTSNYEMKRVKGIFGSTWEKKENNVETSESIIRNIILWNLGIKEKKDKKIKGVLKKGVFEDCYVIYLSPFVGALKNDVLKLDLNYEEIFNEISNTKEPIKRYYLLKSVNQGVSYIIRMIREYKNLNMENERNKKEFYYFTKRLHESWISSPKELYSLMLKKIHPKNKQDEFNLFYLLENSNFIGFSKGGIAYIQPNLNLEEKLKEIEKNFYISILGKGNVLSFNEEYTSLDGVKKNVGGFISLENKKQTLTYQDIVFKKSTYTLYERIFIREFLKEALSHPRDKENIYNLIKRGIEEIDNPKRKKFEEDDEILNYPGSEHLFKAMVRKKERELFPDRTGYYGILVGDTKQKYSYDLDFLKNIDRMDIDYYKKHFYETILPFAKHFLNEKELFNLKKKAFTSQGFLF